MASYVLAGDIGGTKTNLALYHAAQPAAEERGESLVLVREGSFSSARYPGLEDILDAFLDRRESVGAAAFGIAGPVLDGHVTATNLAWQVEATRLSSHLGGAQVRLMNDLEATAYGVLCLDPEEFQTLNPGRERRGHRAIIAAGTGLGQAFLFWDGRQYRAAATEGGHVDFAPRTALEDRLLGHLRRRYTHVSYERLVSGPGLVQLWRFLVEAEGWELTAGLEQRMRTEDPAAVIGQAGVSAECATCEAAVDLFLSIYGAQAGNLALTVMSLGGVYVAGGMIPKLLPRVGRGAFMRAFVDKGRFAALMADIPVRIVLNPKAAQVGAAQAALRLGKDDRDAL